MQVTSQDIEWMTRALRLGARGLYTTTPNPRVGCVIVSNGQVVGEGAHLKAGEPHAEVHALRAAAEQARGATAYVTLEPCSHFGRTPPCADALVNAGVSRVVVAMQDPNPLVAGNGIARLQAQGIAVTVGVCEAQARALNPGFIQRMTQQRPYVRLKVAASLDGRTALANGHSQWITSAAARKDVHHWRAQSCAIVTGIASILQDDSSLTVRDVNTPRQPLRVIVDSQLRIPIDAKVLQDGNALVAYAQGDAAKLEILQVMGVRTLQAPNAQGQVDLAALMQALTALPCNEVLIEAGATLNGAFLQSRYVDELLLYYAPKLMGHTARGMFALPELTQMSAVRDLNMLDVRQFGQDLRIQAKLQP
ncbi:bifunctional diaminohydroxyphosphoribosylaminopyrimidine deaminase/5-amino-6-(5-phosphoribosylamino)uracil reductase RibD [Methylophilus sp. 14]|uniref:bifunctional diaminohydroxyphosphoribosylaminopyrimidine deaminase/5-amino-6-(5-phosphoribosylamino)uracil reductase RibD n=1 Tax=Methylophilus sp. 14 TaxID=2781019 RepID=UPI00188E6DE9|nr:bifunctional diaminohydroxyphosphoribosylaminopyrimidine deaminase/5-amino-6-(5-phosphoribosylamino)uracil reductase RibD [Methylophilus sp. 14]MBF4989224.1 bifunctional diaminohydroxyphosphoribosylaminopyrimidine deaminase/5-amino-6-(5-phosphoribosylamino)uracil reductase RibD [Methylophilus sp. 14]